MSSKYRILDIGGGGGGGGGLPSSFTTMHAGFLNYAGGSANAIIYDSANNYKWFYVMLFPASGVTANMQIHKTASVLNSPSNAAGTPLVAYIYTDYLELNSTGNVQYQIGEE